MVVSRRTFLIGTASVLAAAAVPSSPMFGQIMGATSKGILNSGLGDRLVYEFTLSSMATGAELRSPEWREDPVNFTFYRGEDAVWSCTLNHRATIRWVSFADRGIKFQKKDLMRVVVEPCFTLTTLNIMSDIELDLHPAKRRRAFSECYKWRDGKPELSSVCALDPVDQHVLEKA